jgi:hypothetical protein
VAYNITDQFGIGITQFSTWHSQQLDLLLKKELLASPTPQNIAASWRNEFSYDISTYSGFITKLGLSYRGTNFSLGLTYTSGNYGILKSSASYAIDDQRINQGTGLHSIVSNRKDATLKSFKTPQSFGAGIEYHNNKRCISFSAEYFREIDQYVLFEDTDDSFDGVSTGDAETFISVTTGNDNVLNFALGIQFHSKDKVTWVTGFRTDFNQNANLLLNNSAEYLGTTPDVYHISGGGMFRYGKNLFSIGMDFGYGTSSGGAQLADFSNVTIENLYSFSGKNNVNNKFYSLMLFITYDFIYKRITKTIDQ